MMSKKSINSQKQKNNKKFHPVIAIFIISSILWQGSYFPLQFLLMVVLLLITFIVHAKEVVVPLEVGLLFGISLLCLLSLFLLSEQRYAGIMEFLRTLVFPLTLLLFLNCDENSAEKVITGALMSVAIIGLLAYASVIYIPGAVIASSGRLQSVLQYANTTALLMFIGVLYSIDSFRLRKTPQSLVGIVIFITALLLTGSRLSFIVSLVVGGLYAFMMLGQKGKAIIVGMALLTTFAVFLFSVVSDQRILQISFHEPTLVERWITFQDALKLLNRNWLLGIGVGNWQQWQYYIQSAPYSVKYIHNYYLQLFLDGGILAPLLFSATVFPAVIRGIRAKSIHAYILLAIVLRATLDFDLIFAAVAMIAMFSLAQLSSRPVPRKVGNVRLLAIVPLILVLSLFMSEVFSATASLQLQRGNLKSAMEKSEVALALNPLNTSLYYQMAQSTRNVQETEALLHRAVEENPLDFSSLKILILISISNENYEQALHFVDALIASRPFSEEHQELYRRIVIESANQGVISDAEREQRLAFLDDCLAMVNPLYTQYIKTE
jgi:Lipid A core - O-antigen ligase and related enzymes